MVSACMEGKEGEEEGNGICELYADVRNMKLADEEEEGGEEEEGEEEKIFFLVPGIIFLKTGIAGTH